MGRTTWFNVDGMKKGEWTREEDQMLVAYINEHGLGVWRSLPKRAGLKRCGKSCRLRWLNYLRPGIKRGKFNPQEEEEIIKFHALLGNGWASIAKQMPNRTDNDIKNHWNSCLKKRLLRKGIDPMTHEPVFTVNATSSSLTSLLSPSPSPTPSPSSSSTSSARLLNKLAAGISSRKHGLDRIKTVIFSEQPRKAVEEKMVISNEEEQVLVEIDKKLMRTSSFDEIPCDSHIMTGFVACDDFSSIESYGLYQSDFYDEITEQFDMFLL